MVPFLRDNRLLVSFTHLLACEETKELETEGGRERGREGERERGAK